MGNTQSDEGETTAYQYIKFIPFVGAAYSVVRTMVYACKGNSQQTFKSMIGTLIGTAQSALLLATGGASIPLSVGIMTVSSAAYWGLDRIQQLIWKHKPAELLNKSHSAYSDLSNFTTDQGQKVNTLTAIKTIKQTIKKYQNQFDKNHTFSYEDGLPVIKKYGKTIMKGKQATQFVQGSKSSSNLCPFCGCNRSDNHRHDDVYICRQCGQSWGSLIKSNKAQNVPQSITNLKEPQKISSNSNSQCPFCGCNRSDNHRHDDVYICRQCGQSWGNLTKSQNIPQSSLDSFKGTQTSLSNSSSQCPSCGCNRSDNHRHDDVYICRQCGQSWGKSTNYTKNVPKPSNIPSYQPIKQQVSYTTSLKSQCPYCQCNRADNFRHDDVYICRDCGQSWGKQKTSYYDTKSSKPSQIPSQYNYQKQNNPQSSNENRCPNCSCNRADNYRHDDVYICRQCGQRWGSYQVPKASKSVSPYGKNLDWQDQFEGDQYEGDYDQQQNSHNVKYRSQNTDCECPSCGCSRQDNYRHDNLYICRDCSEKWRS